jgi:hypothetical protein
MSESPTTRKPLTAPPRSATANAGATPWRAALAVRTFDWTATYMPMMPLSALAAAPTRNATPVRQPNSKPTMPVSEKVSNSATSAAMTTAVTIARTAMVLYCRVMNATAPS